MTQQAPGPTLLGRVSRGRFPQVDDKVRSLPRQQTKVLQLESVFRTAEHEDATACIQPPSASERPSYNQGPQHAIASGSSVGSQKAAPPTPTGAVSAAPLRLADAL